MSATEPFLSARGIEVSFGGTRALAGIDLDVSQGEVHAIVGENGAGKSTLLRVLSGDLQSYRGELIFRGRARRFRSPREAIDAGVALIPQELQLISSLRADENILLGHEPRRAGVIQRRRLSSRAAPLLRSLGEEALLSQVVESLQAGQQQVVAIARALSLDARLLIMDEPTASLGPFETARLEQRIRQLAARGVAVVYVSHRLDEVLRLADRVTVLRDGRHIATVPAHTVAEADLVRGMIGRVIERLPPPATDGSAPEVLRVEQLTVPDPAKPSGYRICDASFTVRAGEIVGLAGLNGAGRTDLLLALAGGHGRKWSGRVAVAGRACRPDSVEAARAAGIVLLPEDRKRDGICPHLAVRANLTLSAVVRVSRGPFLIRGRECGQAAVMAARVGLAAGTLETPIEQLSGGNQQKAVLGRCLFASPRVLLLDEPTRGVDLGAKAEIHAQLRALCAQGLGLVVSSSELPEILGLCHRVLVVRQGRIAAVFDHGEATEQRVMEAAAGGGRVDPPEPERNAGRPRGPIARIAAAASTFAARPRRFGQALAAGLGLAAVVLLAVLFSPIRGGRLVFLDPGNLTDILRQVAEKGILAAGITPVIVSGGIDLSVGSVLALAATLTASLLMNGFSVPATVALVVLAGAAIGVVNGAVAARWGLQPFIVTLATMSAARGAARLVSGGAAIPLGFGPEGAPEAFRLLSSTIGPLVSVPGLVFLGCVGLVHVMLTHMRAGRYLYAIGDNERAAVLAGVRVERQKVLAYVLCAALAAVAGVIHCAQLEQGNPNDGVAYELDAIAAVVIGGTPLTGGRGTVGGTLIGTLIIGVINNIMGLNNVDANIQLVLKGAIIVGAVWLQRRRA